MIGLLLVFDFHVEGVDVLLGAGDDDNNAEPEGDEDIDNRFFEPAGAEEGNGGVDEHGIQPHLGRAGAQVGDFERIGGPEAEKGVDHQAAHTQRHEPHQLIVDAVEQKRPADEHRTHEDKVQEVVHVETPLDQPFVACPADGAVEAVGEPLHEDHQR